MGTVVSGWANRGYTVEARPTPLRDPNEAADAAVEAALQEAREQAGRSPDELAKAQRRKPGPRRKRGWS